MKIRIYMDGDDKKMTVFNEDEWIKVDKSILIGKIIKDIKFSNLEEVTFLEIE